jgi:5'-nucleotidase
MIILIDQDGVLADFEHAFLAAWRERHPGIEPVAYEDRKSFNLLEDYPPELRRKAEALYTAPGFIRELPPVPGAIERICTAPLRQYENCVAEKFQWVERHLGRAATERIVMTRDKTLVRGDILIDDKPKVEGAVAQPSWRHIVYDAPYNRHVADRPRMVWADWRSVLAGQLYAADA